MDMLHQYSFVFVWYRSRTWTALRMRVGILESLQDDQLYSVYKRALEDNLQTLLSLAWLPPERPSTHTETNSCTVR